MRPLLWFILLTALVLATADLLVTTLSVIMLIFLGTLFGILLNAISGWVSVKTSIRYRWAFTAIITLLLLVVGGGIWFLESRITQQITQLRTELQSAAEQVVNQYQKLRESRGFLPATSEIQQAFSSSRSTIATQVRTVATYVTWGVTGAAVIFFVGLYVAHDPQLYRVGLIRLVPQPRRSRACEVLDSLQQALKKWMIGRLISMSIIGVATAAGLAVLGVPLPVSLGVIAALLTFIPNIGPILATVPQAMLALQVGTSTVMYVILFNVVLQAVESYLLTPIVQRYEVSLPPALTVTVQLLAAVVIGIVGIMAAAPLTVAAMVIIQMIYIDDRLGDESGGELVQSL